MTTFAPTRPPGPRHLYCPCCHGLGYLMATGQHPAQRSLRRQVCRTCGGWGRTARQRSDDALMLMRRRWQR